MRRKLTNKEFNKSLKEKHPNLIQLTEYKGDKEYISVRCTNHEYEFKTKPNWLKNGRGCKYCGIESRMIKARKKYSDIIEDFNSVHNGKYSYPNIAQEYKNNKSLITIVCPIHGKHLIKALKHLQGQGCPKCSHQSYPHTNESFTEKAKKIHGEVYLYDRITYINENTPIPIECKKHGIFYQAPKNHLNGCGCPKCNESYLEKDIRKILENNEIEYVYEFRKHTKSNKSIDFYIPKYKIAIECQGVQHFAPVEFFGGERKLIIYRNRDIEKYNELLANNDRIVYITDKKLGNMIETAENSHIYINRTLFIEDILIDNKILIDYIKNVKD